MSDVIVDASLAVQWVVQEAHTREARVLLQDWESRQVRRAAPGWFAREIGNVFYNRVVRGLMTVNQAKVGVDVVLEHVILLDGAPAMTKRAIEFADEFNRPASYDAHYLALAEYLDRELWTADEQFWNATRATLPWVRWVGEVSP